MSGLVDFSRKFSWPIILLYFHSVCISSPSSSQWRILLATAGVFLTFVLSLNPSQFNIWSIRYSWLILILLSFSFWTFTPKYLYTSPSSVISNFSEISLIASFINLSVLAIGCSHRCIQRVMCLCGSTNMGQFLIGSISILQNLFADADSTLFPLASIHKYSSVVSSSVFLYLDCLGFRILLGVS